MGACLSESNNPPSLSGDQSVSRLISRLTNQTPNQSNGTRLHHKIVVVGKSGSGKSTVINMFVNLVNEKQYNDPRLIAITQKLIINQKDVILKCNMPEFEDQQSDSLASNIYDSQTSEVSIYELEGRDYDITLIDTPGQGDTKGTKADEENTRKIIQGIQQLTEITCILYIHKSSDLRESLQLKYYINQLKNLLPAEYKNNIVVGFTHVVNPNRIDASSVLKKQGILTDKYVYFENECLVQSQSGENSSKNYWSHNAAQFKKLIELIKPMKQQDTSLLLDLYCKKQAVAKMIYQKQHKIDEVQQRKALNNQIIANIVNVKQTLQNSCYQSSVRYVWKTIKKAKTIKKYVDVDLKKKVTFCFKCCSICHDPCQLKEILNEGDVKIRRCLAFGNGSHDQCKKCSHEPEYHGHTMKIQKLVEEQQQFDCEYVEQAAQFTNQMAINQEVTYAINQLTQKEDNMKIQLQQKEKEIEKDTLFIAVLLNQIKDQSMSFDNQIIIDYIKEHIEITQQNPELTYEEKQFQLNENNKQLQFYQNLQSEIENAQNFNLAKYNQPQLETEIKKLLDEETRIIKNRDFQQV